MRINYVLDSYFPTEKAYGVTTEHTINALVNLGNEVTLFCHKPNTYIEHNILNAQIIYFELSYLNKFLRKISLASYGKISIITWNLSRHLTYFENRKKLAVRFCDLFWTRDNPIPQHAKLNFQGTQVVEVHSNPSIRTYKLLNALDGNKVLICPISKTLEELMRISLPNNEILWSPMGIQLEDTDTKELISEIERHYGSPRDAISIGYFGKLAPNGISKGFEDLLDLGLELSRQSVAFSLLFIGPRDSELKLLKTEIEKRGIGQDKISIQTHLPHKESLKLMRNCDFLMLPANRDVNYSGFPLKALEYVASLRVVLAAKTQANSEVFLQKFQPFWYEYHNVQALTEIVVQPPEIDFLKNYLLEGYRYAHQFTWVQRTKKILDSINELSQV